MMRMTMMSLVLASATAGALGATEGSESRSTRGPGVRVWTSSGDLFRRNERVRVYYRTERDAFVTILRVDTDGRVRVLFPRHPEDDNFATAGRSYTVSSWDRGTAFVVDDYPGVGYVFAIASQDPFDYRPIYEGDRWSLYRVSDGRIHGDPRATLEDMMAELLPRDYDGWDTHITAYHVERRYDYPRFVCYDCHAYVPFSTWNPYHNWCRSYTLVVWNDPWYYHPSYWYPTRYYGGRRVIYTNPGSPARYVFKEREGNGGGVDYRRRDVATYVRRPEDRGVRGTDIGGVDAVPTPGTSGRRYSGAQPAPRGEDRPRDERPRVNDGGGRRGIEIVPEPSGGDPTRPELPRSYQPEPRRAEPATREPEGRRTERAEPATRQPAARGTERAEPARQPEARGTERAQPRPEAPKPAPEARTPETRAPERAQPRPESRPQSPPPQSRPERAQPQSRPERAQPQQPSSRESGGQVRRRP